MRSGFGAALACVALSCQAPAPVGDVRPAPLVAAARRLPLGPATPAVALGSDVPPRTLSSLPVVAGRGVLAGAPLRAPLVWQGLADEGGVALAVVSGADAAGQVTELVEIDTGVVRWRVAEPRGTVVGVTRKAIIGADRGTWALAPDGSTLWETEAPFLAMAGDAVVVGAAESKLTVLDAATGRDVMRLAVPEPLLAADVRWVCPARGEAWLLDERAGLHRLVAAARQAGEGAPHATLAWSAPIAATWVEGCGETVLVATAPDVRGRYEVARVDRDSGRLVAKVSDVLAHWIEEPGVLVTSQAATMYTPGGVRRWDRALTSSHLLSAQPTRERLASAGDWLVARGLDGGVVAIHSSGAWLPLALAADSAALGSSALLTAISSASPAHTVARWRWDDMLASAGSTRAWARAKAPALPPSPLRVVGASRLSAASLFVTSGVAERGAIAALPDGVVAVLRDDRGMAVTRLDARGRAVWTTRGCAGDSPLVAADGQLAICATRRGSEHGELAAFDVADGALRWTAAVRAESLQLVAPWGLARSADRATLFDDRGRTVAAWTSTHGGGAHAALVAVAGAVLLVTEEDGALVGRWPAAGLVPLWSRAVRGAVASLAPAGDHVLVTTTAGEAFAVHAQDGAATAMPREAEELFATGEGILAVTRSSGPPAFDAMRVALFSLAGALRWEYDVALPGRVSVRPSARVGDTFIAFGDEVDRVLPLTAAGLGEPFSLPASVTSAAWHRLSAPPSGWIGLSTTAAQGWGL